MKQASRPNNHVGEWEIMSRHTAICNRCNQEYSKYKLHRCYPEKSEGAKIAEKEMAKAVETYKIVGIDKAIVSSVFEKEIWNEAIEAAALVADETDKDYHDVAAAKIRKLKKW